MSITKDQVREILDREGYDPKLIESYIQFAEERLGSDWNGLFNNEDELIEDVELYVKAVGIGQPPNNTEA